MVLIAVAGGSSALGRAIVKAILKTPNTCIIIARRFHNGPERKYDADVRFVDYTDEIDLVEALKGVHTVISAIKATPPYGAEDQLALLGAAKRAGVKRFVPSAFEAGWRADGRVELFKMKEQVWQECCLSGLEVARFHCGMFMNHLALGRDFEGDTEREKEVLGGFKGEPWIWDVAAGRAEEPVKDDGRSPRITLTTIEDVGKFVAAACELPDSGWGREMNMAGETIAVSEVTRLIEEVTGKMPVVEKIDRHKLKQRVESIKGCGSNAAEISTKLHSQLALLMIEEKNDLMIIPHVLNNLCPHVQKTCVKEYLLRCWKE